MTSVHGTNTFSATCSLGFVYTVEVATRVLPYTVLLQLGFVMQPLLFNVFKRKMMYRSAQLQ